MKNYVYEKQLQAYMYRYYEKKRVRNENLDH